MIERHSLSPRIAVGFAALLVVLLTVLATLQYRWAGQVSDGERERMRTSLRVRASQFTQDFDRELTRALVAFQSGSDSIAANPGRTLTERYAQWAASTPYPQLVTDIYLFEQEPGRAGTLRRLDRATATITPSPWPDSLARLRAHFETVRVAPGPLGSPWPDPIDERAPALFIPLMDVKVSTDGAGGEVRRIQALEDGESFRLVVLMLDRDTIRRTILPALAARYFSSDEGFDYQVAVIDRAATPEIVYASDDRSNPRDTAKADLTTGILNLRLDDLPMITGMLRLSAGAGHVTTRRDRFSVAIVRRGAKSGSGPDRIVNDLDDQSRWQLVLRHRAGSLEAAVQRSRTRNLLVSFGVLLLLAVASTMVLVSTERARRLAARQIEFVAGVSHELRTPVAVICSAAENLADGVIEDGEHVRRYGNLIRHEGRRLADMLERVLELAGVWSGRAVARLVPTDAAAVIDESIAAMQTPLVEAGVHVERTIAPDLPSVLGDPVALRSAVQNLIANAVKYRGNGRSIRIGACAAVSDGAPVVEVTVADSGVGIAPEDLPHIFEPFYRGRAAAADQIRGTGVGLTVVKRIVEAHGGTVSAASEPGRGSVFTMRIPAHRPAAEEPRQSYGGADLQVGPPVNRT